MATQKHLTLQDRSVIQSMLENKYNFSQIANTLDKDPTTISKEVKAHTIIKNVGAAHTTYNACEHRFTCTKSHICIECVSLRKYTLCRRCNMCNAFCKSFKRQTCTKLSKVPHVCNGCGERSFCSLDKHLYIAVEADKAYRSTLVESRSGITYSQEELLYIDEFVSPLIKQGQSPHHICSSNEDELMISERSIYRLIDSNLISAINLDLPRKVRFKTRKVKKVFKIDRLCRVNRDYECFKTFMDTHPDYPVVQLDSVEGKKGGKVLLTIHFVKAEFMLAILRDHNTSRSVTEIFEMIYWGLGHDKFTEIFKVCLADNGSEFSNPSAIEFNSAGVQRTSIFYCNPQAPYQKGSAERNHEFIREFIPKGTDLLPYDQSDISLMMNHINSYRRASLGNKSPYEMFEFIYGTELLDLFGCYLIPPQEVTLNKSIFRKEVD